MFVRVAMEHFTKVAVAVVFFNLASVVAYVFSGTKDVWLTCVSCSKQRVEQNGIIHATVGSDVIVQYNINNVYFRSLTILFNGTKNMVEIAPDTINEEGVNDKRFSISRTGNATVAITTIRLRGV